MFKTDIDVLNHALSLEHLESTFYSQTFDMFTADDLRGQDVFDRTGRSPHMSPRTSGP